MVLLKLNDDCFVFTAGMFDDCQLIQPCLRDRPCIISYKLPRFLSEKSSLGVIRIDNVCFGLFAALLFGELSLLALRFAQSDAMRASERQGAHLYAPCEETELNNAEKVRRAVR